jgi:hypothetical protein
MCRSEHGSSRAGQRIVGGVLPQSDDEYPARVLEDDSGSPWRRPIMNAIQQRIQKAID